MSMENIDISNFTSVSSLNGDDNITITLFSGKAGKISVALFKNIITKGITPSIDENGFWCIGETNTQLKAEGKTPEFRKGVDGIDVKYTTEDDTMWKMLIHYEDLRMRYEDLSEEQLDTIRLKYSDLTDEQIAELQRPATDMIAELTATNNEVKANEESRVEAETIRESNEGIRVSNEEERVANETQRVTQESQRVSSFESIMASSEEATANAEKQAAYAKTQGDYAKSQGDYAEQYVTEIGDYKARIEALENRLVACTQDEFDTWVANGEINEDVYYNILEE